MPDAVSARTRSARRRRSAQHRARSPSGVARRRRVSRAFATALLICAAAIHRCGRGRALCRESSIGMSRELVYDIDVTNERRPDLAPPLPPPPLAPSAADVEPVLFATGSSPHTLYDANDAAFRLRE